MSSNLAEKARKLSISERINLVQEIWNSIAEDNGCFELTEPQKQELDRRLASLQIDPSQGRTWNEIKAAISCRFAYNGLGFCREE